MGKKLMIPIQTKIIGSSFHKHGVYFLARCNRKDRNILEKNLFLKIFGPGRNDCLFIAEEDRDKVAQSFSGAGPGFDQSDGIEPERLQNQICHLELGGPDLKFFKGVGQQTALSQNCFDGIDRIGHRENIAGVRFVVNG